MTGGGHRVPGAGAVWPPVSDAVEGVLVLGGGMSSNEPLFLLSPQLASSGPGH